MKGPIQARLADALARLALLSRSGEQRAADSEALSSLQARVLAVLERRPGLRVGELAEELLVSYGTVSAAISTLEEKGLVAKYVDPDEHRAVIVEATRRGSAAAKRALAAAGELLAPAVEELPDDEAAVLLASLIKLLRALERRGAISPARMCVSCRWFEPGGGDGAKPHYCHLLEAAIGRGELRVHCTDHERAAPEREEELWRDFQLAP